MGGGGGGGSRLSYITTVTKLWGVGGGGTPLPPIPTPMLSVTSLLTYSKLLSTHIEQKADTRKDVTASKINSILAGRGLIMYMMYETIYKLK